jgi:hypothetical protein
MKRNGGAKVWHSATCRFSQRVCQKSPLMMSVAPGEKERGGAQIDRLARRPKLSASEIEGHHLYLERPQRACIWTGLSSSRSVARVGSLPSTRLLEFLNRVSGRSIRVLWIDPSPSRDAHRRRSCWAGEATMRAAKRQRRRPRRDAESTGRARTACVFLLPCRVQM